MRNLSRLLHSARPSARVSAMSAPATAMPRVAVVGGGLAGLACASELQGAGIAAHVFDMGSRGPGQFLRLTHCKCMPRLLHPVACLTCVLRSALAVVCRSSLASIQFKHTVGLRVRRRAGLDAAHQRLPV